MKADPIYYSIVMWSIFTLLIIINVVRYNLESSSDNDLCSIILFLLNILVGQALFNVDIVSKIISRGLIVTCIISILCTLLYIKIVSTIVAIISHYKNKN